MPPSLTLSKIRSLKQQALVAALKAKLEISTVALAIVYFERLCLDCRVDKTNRRLSFAACLLIAVKVNEDLKALGKQDEVPSSAPTSTKKARATAGRLQSLIRPTKKVDSMFASLLTFFTQDWNISLKHLFAAEWGVFAALQFRLNAKPSHVAFHFKRLMKGLGRDPRRYLGVQMYGYWQQALVEEEIQRAEREERMEVRRKRKEKEKLRQLELELEAANRREANNRSASTEVSDDYPQGRQEPDQPQPDEEGRRAGTDARETVDGKSSAAAKDPPFAIVPLKEELSDGRPPTGSTAKRRGTRHGLGDIFKLPLGSKRPQSIERDRVDRSRRSRHDSSASLSQTTATTETGRVGPSTTREGSGPGGIFHRPIRPMSKEVVRPLSKSVSMFARTSLEQDVIAETTTTTATAPPTPRGKGIPTATTATPADSAACGTTDADPVHNPVVEDEEEGIVI
jgi:hypothetical protein